MIKELEPPVLRGARSPAKATQAFGRWGFAVALVLSAAALRAEPAPHAQRQAFDADAKPFRVAFNSSAGCKDPAEFTRILGDLTPHLRPALADEAGFTFFVHLTATQAGVHGQLGVLPPGGALTVREVEDADCQVVMKAMAFIGAVMVDPLKAPLIFAPPKPPSPPSPRRREPRRKTEDAELHLDLGDSAGLYGAIAPSPSVGLALYAEVEYERAALLSPSARIALISAKNTADVSFAGASPNAHAGAAFAWSSAHVSLCPLRLVSGRNLSLRPCVSFDAGQLEALGFGTQVSRRQTLFWSAAGAELLATFVRVGPLAVGAQGGFFFPFLRNGFYFDDDPSLPVHMIPRIGAAAALTLALRAF